ncbi:MAG: hypothetical protein ACE5KQ_05015 [Thermoplasmata archaeon]
MSEIIPIILHGGAGDYPLFGHPEAMLTAAIIAAVVLGVGGVVLFLVRKFFFQVEKKW